MFDELGVSHSDFNKIKVYQDKLLKEDKDNENKTTTV